MARRFLTNLVAPRIGLTEQNGVGPSVLYLNTSENISADRTVTINPSNANRTVTLSGDTHLNQDVHTFATPSFQQVTSTVAAPSIAGHLTRKDYVDAADDSHQAAAEATAANAMLNHVTGFTSHHDADVIDVDTAAFTGVLDTGLQPDLQTILEAIEAHLTPTGVVAPFAGSTEPTGWLLCQGQAVSRTTYSALFAVIGTTYGAGDGSTTFNLPDLRSKFPVGKGTETWSDSLGETGGSKDAVVVDHSHDMTHGHADTLAAPAHTHTLPNHVHTMAHTHSIDPPSTTTSTTGAHTHTQRINGFAAVGATGNLGGNAANNANGGATASAGGHEHTVNIASFTSGGSSAANTGNPTTLPASGGASSTTLTGSVTNFTGNTQNSGVSGTSANLPPYVTLNYIIKV